MLVLALLFVSCVLGQVEPRVAIQRPSSVATALAGRADECSVTLTWHQKDAYAKTAGRKLPSALWPPHTTTVLTVECRGQPKQVIENVNHGTSISAVDAAGVKMLDHKKSVTVKASAKRTADLIAAMSTCKCDPQTTFLSMDMIKGGREVQVATGLAAIVRKELTCPAGLTPKVAQFASAPSTSPAAVALLTQVAQQCIWSDGRSWARGVEQALNRALGPDNKSYHVCNNDAMLQSSLFSAFAAGRRLVCDNSRAMCSGPRFFYDPA